MQQRLIRLTLALAWIAGPATSQDWTQIITPSTPPQVTGHQIDAIGGGLLLFGGNSNGTYINDTWSFDGTSWLQLNPATSPPSRRRHGAAWDAVRGRLVLFGGQDNSGAEIGDTWEFDGANWVQLNPATAPSARRDHVMVFDANSGRTLLFGGRTATSPALNDTWEWDGVTWLQRAPATAPSPRWDHQAVYDTITGQVVLFGGGTAANARLSDTWVWNGVDWASVLTPMSPSGRWTPGMTYDPRRQRVVLFGGYDGGYRNDVWEFDGQTWRERAVFGAVPQGRGGSQLKYDPILAKVYVFGGWSPGAVFWNDTWELGANLVWQTNQPPATLMLDGAGNSGFIGPVAVTKLVGASGTTSLESILVGSPFEVGFNAAPAVPTPGGGVALPGGQLVNLNLASGLAWSFGGFSTVWPGGPLAFNYVPTAPFVVTGQMVVIDPSQAAGFSLSAAGEITSRDCAYLESVDGIPLGVGSYPPGWGDGGGTAQWQPGRAGTPTPNTGPQGDHTNGQGLYMFCETNAPNTGATFILDLGIHTVSQLVTPHADFWYHMNGTGMGTLTLEQFDGLAWNSAWTLSGPRGPSWLNARVPLVPAAGNVTLRLVYAAGGSNTGDVAIDDVGLCN